MCKVTNTEQFIARAISIHGDTYDYSISDYKKTDEKLIITCKQHGEFLQTPNVHLQGKGCPECGRNRLLKHRSNLVENNAKCFIEKSIKIHGNKYTYDDFVYTKAHEKSIVTCVKHGNFLIRPASLLEGKGCELCSQESQRNKMTYTIGEFIEMSNIVHNNKFNYDSAVYVNTATKIEIICPHHGSFWQLAGAHLHGSGCQQCGVDGGFSWSRSKFIKKYNHAICYIIGMSTENESFVKIGITGNSIKNRNPGNSKYKVYKFLEIKNKSEFIWDLEKWLHRQLHKFKYKPKIKFGGSTECFNFKVMTEIEDLLLNNPFIKVELKKLKQYEIKVEKLNYDLERT